MAAAITAFTRHYLGIFARCSRAIFRRRPATDRARCAFVEAMGALGNLCHDIYEQAAAKSCRPSRRRKIICSRHGASPGAHGWWDGAISAMQGLRTLYGATGRSAARGRLVDEVVPDFVDPASDGSLAGREDHWSPVTEYSVRLAREGRNRAEAERLQRGYVDWDRQSAEPALAMTADRRDARQRHAIETLATSLQLLADTQRQQDSPTCAATFRKAIDLASAIGDTTGQAIYAFNLGACVPSTGRPA